MSSIDILAPLKGYATGVMVLWFSTCACITLWKFTLDLGNEHFECFRIFTLMEY